jgi:hypothetical protein
MDILSNNGAKIWRFWGIPRSGNHAIIEWVIKNIDDSSLVFLNNCNRGLPTETFSYTVFDRGYGPEKHRGNIHRDKNRHYERLINAIERAENIVVSYEVFPVNDIMLSDLREESWMSSAKTQDVFILRSPLNLLASCIRRIENETTHKARVAGRVRNFMDNQFSHYSGYLERCIKNDKNCVIYDIWGAEESYRLRKLTQLGIKPTDLALGGMTSAGGGSSFDSEQEVNSISTSNRWVQSVDNVHFIEMVDRMNLDAKLMAAISKVFPKDHENLIALKVAG